MDNPDLPVAFHEIFMGLSWSITLHSKIRIHVLCRSKKISATYNNGFNIQFRTLSERPRYNLQPLTSPEASDIFDLK